MRKLIIKKTNRRRRKRKKLEKPRELDPQSKSNLINIYKTIWTLLKICKKMHQILEELSDQFLRATSLTRLRRSVARK